MLNLKKSACVSLGFMTSFALNVASAQAIDLVSYQAGYNVRLSDARETSQVTAVTGQVAFDFEKICSGWLFQQSGNMQNHLPDGNVIPQIFQFSSVENGGAYQFSIKTDGVVKESILGRAEMPQNGEAGQAVFNRPENLQFALPKGTLFPAAHTRFMLEAAQSGKTQVQSYIFEGTDIEPAKLLVAFVSPLSDAGKAVINELGGDLKNHTGWNFRLAYFDPKNQTGESLYEVGVDQLDNGIALRWVVDYGSHAVEMKMVKIRTLDKPDCSPK